jgi:3-hydroxybutyryl-CoA dehydrogenase
MAELERVGVVGFGLMGSGIAEVCARAGCDVVVLDATEAALRTGRERLSSSLRRAVRLDKLTENELAATLRRIHTSTEQAELADRQIVFEAIVEEAGAKRELFSRLAEVVSDRDAIFASNTSTIPIVKLAAATSRPEAVIGTHFFNPVPVMPLVELTASLRTSPEVLARTEAFVTVALKKSVIHSSDRAGFIVNGLLIPYLLSAVRMLEAKHASAEDIDAGMVLGCRHPLGPLALCDFIGLDTVMGCAESMYREYRDPALVTPPLLARMVEAGLLGKKSGRGFYAYG